MEALEGEKQRIHKKRKEFAGKLGHFIYNFKPIYRQILNRHISVLLSTYSKKNRAHNL